MHGQSVPISRSCIVHRRSDLMLPIERRSGPLPFSVHHRLAKKVTGLGSAQPCCAAPHVASLIPSDRHSPWTPFAVPWSSGATPYQDDIHAMARRKAMTCRLICVLPRKCACMQNLAHHRQYIIFLQGFNTLWDSCLPISRLPSASHASHSH